MLRVQRECDSRIKLAKLPTCWCKLFLLPDVFDVTEFPIVVPLHVVDLGTPT